MDDINIINDNKISLQLKYQGFSIVPLLASEQINTLKSYFYSNHHVLPEGMYASSHSEDVQFRKKMSETIISLAEESIKSTFSNIKILGATYIVKNKGEYGSLPPHQDWNIVDEHFYRSFNLWIPLVDTNQNNGGIKVLPQSHLFGFTFRGPNISSAYEQITDLVEEHMLTLEIPAGHCLIYDHRLLHASGINKTNEPRLVVVVGAIEQGSGMVIYYKENDSISCYQCSEEFFLEGNPLEGPKTLQLLKKIKWNLPQYQTKDLIRMFNKNKIDINFTLKMKYIGIQFYSWFNDNIRNMFKNE
jgi:effector-binding domain-containing protein